MNDAEQNKRKLISFIVGGVLIQAATYFSIKAFININDMLPATILVMTLLINGLIFQVGCFRMSLKLSEKNKKG